MLVLAYAPASRSGSDWLSELFVVITVLIVFIPPGVQYPAACGEIMLR